MSAFWLVDVHPPMRWLWVGVLDWVGRDSERLGLRHRFWSALVAAVGGAGMALDRSW